MRRARSAPCFAASSRADCCRRSRSNARPCSPSSSASTRRAMPRFAASSRPRRSRSRSKSLADLGLSAGDVGEAGSHSRVRRMCHSRQGPGAAHRGRCGGAGGAARGDHPRIQRRCGLSGVLVDRGAAARRAAPGVPGAHRRRPGAARRRRRSGRRGRARLRPRTACVDALKLAGVDEIVAVKVAAAEFDPDTFEAAAGALIADRASPDVVLVAHSVDSFGYAAALAARLDLGFATDVFKVGTHRRRAGRDPRRIRPEGERRGRLPRPQPRCCSRSAPTYSSPRSSRATPRVTEFAAPAGGEPLAAAASSSSLPPTTMST